MSMPTLAQQARWVGRGGRWLAASAVLAALGILAGSVMPRFARLMDLRQQNDAALRELGKTEDQLASLRSDAQFALLPEAGSTSQCTDDAAGWIRRMTDMSQTRRLKAVTVQAGMPGRAGSVARVPLVLNFDGNYLDACAFLEDAERLPAAVRISTLHIRCTDLPTGQVEVQVAMNAYIPENP